MWGLQWGLSQFGWILGNGRMPLSFLHGLELLWLQVF